MAIDGVIQRAAEERRERSRVSSERVDKALYVFGTKTELAAFLEVSKTQPKRWHDGHESPTPKTQRALFDLAYISDRVFVDMGLDSGGIWLNSPNAFLSGATPLSWLKQHGPSRVIEALDANEAGSYA